MITGIIIATATVSVTGLLIGIFLGLAGEKFKVIVDEREEKIIGVLPGNNCGGCGYAGCSGLASAIVKGEAPVNGCPVGGNSVAEKVSEIMGVEATSGAKKVAYVRCQGDCDKAANNYEYTGSTDCHALLFVPDGGPKKCKYGCLGGGSCVKACPFDAISIINGIAVVNKEKCTSCGNCVKECSQGLIELVPYDKQVRVSCFSKDKGPAAMKTCQTACIGCGICAKNCPFEAITIENNLAVIDYDKCKNCGLCATKCPRNSIINYKKKA